MNVGISKATRQVVVPPDQRIPTLIPHATPHEKNGKTYWLVPHRIQETKLLRNIGYNAPAPVSVHYDWRGTTPFDSQVHTVEMLTQNRRAFVLNDMGTGKTRSALFSADFLMQLGEVRKALIIAPLSTLTTVWEREIFTVMPRREAVVLHGTRKKRLEMLARPDVHFYIINPDGLQIVRDDINARPDVDLVIIDELTAFRNKRTRRWKQANEIVRGRRYVWGMTGSPTPNAPTDAWAQTLLLAPDNVPKYFKQFRDSTMIQVTQFRWVPKQEATDIVHKAMQPSIRYSRDECVDLPPLTFTDLEAELSPDQKKAYKEMLAKFAVQVAEGKITAANAGVQMSKLLQIASGFVYGPNETVADISAPNRESVLEELLEEIGSNKAIIFAPFKHLVHHLHTKLGAKFRVASITGETSKKERDEIFHLFQHASAPQFLIAHPGTMSHGVNLHRANTIIWYSPTVSLETYEQANARITRPGQQQNMLIAHITGSPVERQIYKRLQQKASVQNLLLEMFGAQKEK